jgi:LPS-assembly protein
MFKQILLLFIICILSLSYAKSIDLLKKNNIEKLQILAKVIKTENNVIIASGDVLVHSKRYYITAGKVIYNKDNSTLELFNNVNIIKDGKITTYGEYAFLDFSKEIYKYTPVLLIDSTNNIWINAKNAKKNNHLFDFKNSTLSSCDCNNPAWSISFTKGDYNTSKQWINTYNTTLFLNNFPILYTPYFGFPTDDTRHTGFLQPIVGLSSQEGVYYAQPFFYAPSLNWDLEYIPQIRTSRGSGHQLKYRIKDSTASFFKLQAGIFTENSNYFNNSNLIHKQHYGADLDYVRGNLFSKNDNQDGLLISLHSLNDVDYINTQYKNESDVSNKLVESDIKYFYNTNNLYGNIAFKYYNDTSKNNNNDTMQELPKIHLHKYSSKTFIKNILYSADIKFSNKSRIIGLKAKTTNITIPLIYSTKFFNDYIKLSFSEVLSIVDIKYGNNKSNYKDGQFIENRHTISLSTDLLKPYKDHIHAFNLKASLAIPKISKQKGDLYSINNTTTTLNVFPITKTQKNINFALNQSIYDKNTLSQLLNHKINQSIIFNDNGTSKLSDLENDLTLIYRYGKLSNRFLYNYKDQLIISSSTSLSFINNNFASNIYYNYSKDTSTVSSSSTSYSYKNLPDTKNLTYSLSYNFDKFYTLSYKEEYDLKSKISKSKEYILKINKKCWSFNLKLANNLIASSTTNNNPIRQNIFYLELALKPIILINQEFIQKKRAE